MTLQNSLGARIVSDVLSVTPAPELKIDLADKQNIFFWEAQNFQMIIFKTSGYVSKIENMFPHTVMTMFSV